jgi:hypothetical protein
MQCGRRLPATPDPKKPLARILLPDIHQRRVYASMINPLVDYRTNGAWDELIDSEGQPRPHAQRLMQYLASLDEKELLSRKVASEIAIREMGISFTVYTEGGNIDRAWPFDIIPRIIELSEWRRIED